MRTVVVALGKIGLPLAAYIASAGHDVVGCDIDQRVVDSVNRGVPPFPGESGLREALEAVIHDGKLRATTETREAVAEGPELVVAVPPLMVDDRAQPDFRILDAVIEEVGLGLRSGSVVSVETTLPVRTTRSRIGPMLARYSGLEPEQEFFTVHSPERVSSGRVFRDLDTYPKLVGGLTDTGEQRAVELYRQFMRAEVRAMGSAEAAELAKLAETTYRDVNIALANEFARYADSVGIDIERVIEASNSQPFSHVHRPGVAVGGHCIPVYPHFYLAGDPGARLPSVAREINESMPAYAVELLESALGEPLRDRRVLILGATYRGGVKETAFSGAFGLRDELRKRDAIPLVSDPLLSAAELEQLGLASWDKEPVDAAIVQTDHPEYRGLGPNDLPGVRAIIDGRGVLDPHLWRSDGIVLRRIGGPAAPRR